MRLALGKATHGAHGHPCMVGGLALTAHRGSQRREELTPHIYKPLQCATGVTS